MDTILTESYVEIIAGNEEQNFRTIPDCLEHYAATNSEGEAIVIVSTDGKRESITWLELYEKSCKVAKSFVHLGLKRYDVAAINFRTCPEWLYATFGAMMAGAIPISVSFTYADGSDLIALMEKLKTCSLLVMDPGHDNVNWEILRQHLDEFTTSGRVKSQMMPYLRYLIGLDFDEAGAHLLDFNDLLCPADVVLPKLNPTDICSLFQTSGSTGVPKVVAHTHEGYIHITAKYFEVYDSRYKLFNDRPFTWGGGYPFSVLTGQTRVTVSGRCEPPKDNISFMIDVIERERCSALFILPPALHELNKRQSELPFDWPIVITVSGGQPMTKQSAAGVGKCCQSLVCMYGGTEFSIVTQTKVKQSEEFTEYACGKPIRYPGLAIKIVNENGSVVPVNTKGEIYIRSPSMFKEYFNDPVKTKAAKTDDGWFRTDDIGRMTENGEIFVEGRKSNTIISGGFNVAPEILEQVMKNFVGVESVVIVPVPDKTYYQVVCACVIKKTEYDVDEEKLRKYCEEFHADKPGLFTVLPKFYLFFERFPETTSGKWNRKELENIATQRFKFAKLK